MLVCGCAAGLYFFFRADEELRLHVEKKLIAIYPNHTVSVGSAHFVKGEGIRLHRVSIVQLSEIDGSRRNEIVFCDEAVLHCASNLESLIRGQVDVQRIRLRGLSLHPTRAPDGRWNFAELLPRKKLGPPTPTLLLEDARIQLADSEHESITLRHIHAKVVPPRSPDEPTQVTVRFQNKYAHSDNLNLKVYPAYWSATASISNLQCNAELYRLLKTQISNLPQALEQFQADVDLHDVRLVQSKHERSPRFIVKGSFTDGRFDAPGGLANPLTSMSSKEFEVTRTESELGWRVEKLNARFGESRIACSARSPSLSIDGDLKVAGEAENLKITPQLISLFPRKLQQTWAKYRPLGWIDVKFLSVRKNGKWWSAADANCRDVSILSQYFKYPLVRSQGTVHFRQDEKLELDLWAATDHQATVAPIHILADVNRPGRNFDGTISIQSHQHGIPLDRRVRDALSPRVRDILVDMQASGEIQFDARLWRNAETGGKLAKQITIDVRQGSLTHTKFPYPLKVTKGRIQVEEDVWTFSDFEGRNDSCVVTAAGNWFPPDPLQRRDSELALTFTAANIPCDAELRDALPSGPQKIWESLRPTGHVDHATIHLTYRDSMEVPQLDVLVKHLPRQNQPTRGGLEIQPTWFPLRMHQLSGTADYRSDGSFQLQDLKAVYGSDQRSVELQSKGGGTFRPDGSWVVRLDQIIADGVEVTPELTAALPRDLSDAIKGLQFNGKLSIDGAMQFAGGSHPDAFVDSNWSSFINIDNGSFAVANTNVRNLYGELTVQGQKSLGQISNWGLARFDSLICKGVQITKTTTPWQMDQKQLVFGNAASAAMDAKGPHHLTAELFGGVAQADGVVSLGDDHEFRLNVALNNFDASEVARDLEMPSKISGLGEAKLQLTGNAEGTHTLNGSGGIRLRDADLAKLPQIITLVNTLRVRDARPDVFSSSDIDFTIDGPHLYLSRFDLHGESLSLKGRGWIGFDRRINLSFYTILGGENRWLPIVRPFVGQASQQLLQIPVTGTLDNMQWDRKVLPGLNDLFPEQARRGGMEGLAR